jgi:hypothetical protein
VTALGATGEDQGKAKTESNKGYSIMMSRASPFGGVVGQQIKGLSIARPEHKPGSTSAEHIGIAQHYSPTNASVLTARPHRLGMLFHAPGRVGRSFDHFIGKIERARWHSEIERLRRLEVDDLVGGCTGNAVGCSPRRIRSA